jgi:hypothetical protein
MAIEFLNPRSAADVDRVATLYEEHLADSPVVLLGPRFLREFFFRQLVESKLLDVLVCRHDGKVVAFLSWTNHPGDFIGRGIKKHFIALSWIMLKGVLAKPASLKQILSAIRIVSKRSGDAGKEEDPKAIEAISLVVPPEFQKHIPPGGKARTTVRAGAGRARPHPGLRARAVRGATAKQGVEHLLRRDGVRAEQAHVCRRGGVRLHPPPGGAGGQCLTRRHRPASKWPHRAGLSTRAPWRW